VVVALLTGSCRSREPEPVQRLNPDRAQMEEVNRYLVQKDRERIENYIERKQLSMTMTPSGLYYSISERGKEPFFVTGDVVTFDYRCSLLDGTECYSSEESGQKRVVLGKSSIESGLDQGLRMLGRGGEALFIIPSFLAHGLLGDGQRIPAMAVLVYEVKVKKELSN
jgi:FKBP-type peptidyl-prolyl cis-trans isomerase FkpA